MVVVVEVVVLGRTLGGSSRGAVCVCVGRETVAVVAVVEEVACTAAAGLGERREGSWGAWGWGCREIGR